MCLYIKITIVKVENILVNNNMNKYKSDIPHKVKSKCMRPVGKIVKKWADDSNINAEYFEKIESTNDHAKKSENSLVITDYQTCGRGRGNNQWTCPRYGDGFLTTWIFTISDLVQPIFSPLVGLALYTALCKTWNLNDTLSLKPPNDIYLGREKLAGILIETISQSKKTKVLIGIGVNIFSHPQNPEKGLNATSLAACHLPLDETHIRNFTSYLWQELYINPDSALSESLVSHITPSKRENIKTALNKHPSKTHYQNVLPDGSLETSSGIIPWQKL